MADSSGVLSWQIGPWIVSILALVQVWIIALWRRFVRRPKLSIHESGLVEIGYSGFGPTLALIGTLRCLHRDTFISAISLNLVRLKDNARHHFAWRAFRGHTIWIGDPKPISLEIATSFMLTTTSPYKFNIFFNDEKVLDELKAKVGDVRSKWQEYLQAVISGQKETGLTLDQLLANAPTAEAAFSEFGRRSDITEAYSIIDRLNYWEEGDYSLQMIVETTEPDRTFSKNWYVSLTADHARQLQINAIGFLRDQCGLVANYNFANVPYRKST